jgi:putative membrane protein
MPHLFRNLTWGLSAAVILSLGQQAVAQDLSAQDRKFIQDAAKGGMMEVHMGRLGAEHGSSADVKTFSQRLINDHTKANHELADLAKKKGVTLPADNPTAAPKGLDSKTGTDFDKTFAKIAVEDHEKDIKEFEKEANSGSDPDVKEWASKTLPTLQAHLDEAKALKP